MEVKCPGCNEKIADYTGPMGPDIPVESRFYTRIDGSQPAHGSSTSHNCPHCGVLVNELIAVFAAYEQEQENDQTVGNSDT